MIDVKKGLVRKRKIELIQEKERNFNTIMRIERKMNIWVETETQFSIITAANKAEKDK